MLELKESKLMLNGRMQHRDEKIDKHVRRTFSK